MYTQGKAQKTHEKTLNLYLILFLGTETDDTDDDDDVTKTASPSERRKSDFQSYHTTRCKYPLFNQKIPKHTKKH